MLDNGPQVATECRPDPEKMLQNARKDKEKAILKMDQFKEFVKDTGGYYDSKLTESATYILGYLTNQIWEAEKTEQHWLAEIDK